MKMNNNPHTKNNVIRVTDKERGLIKQIRDFQDTTTTEHEVVYETANNPIMYEEGKNRVLVIGDLHAPFDLPEYLDHCIQVYNDFSCNKVVFIGDLIDNHYSSYHNTDPDGLGGGDELDEAIRHVHRYYEAFPEATVIIGNHDRMSFRKAFSGGVPKAWIKDYKEVLHTPKWVFVVEAEIDDVLYFHGEGGTAKTKYKCEEQPVVQGHLHTQAYIEWLFSKSHRKFAMQIGTGIDFQKYAFAYAKAGKKPAVSCGVVLNGLNPFLIPMNL
jgi:metallophosphoesterase superfamily enzyme